IDHDVENVAIDRRIRAARELAEKHTGRAWLTQTFRLTLPGWPCGDWPEWSFGLALLTGYGMGAGYAVRLPIEPVQSVPRVKYYAFSGVLQTMPGSDYQAWLDYSPPLVCPGPLSHWPGLQSGKLAPVEVTFVAGEAAADSVPARAVEAILLTLSYWYE